MALRHRLAIALGALTLAACSYDCGTRRRTVASGTVRDSAGAALAAVEVDLSDNLNPTFLLLSAGVMGAAGSGGAPLRGHVVAARLVTGDGALLAEIPTGTATLYVDAVVALNVHLSSSSDYARVRAALLSEQAKVVLDTDRPGLARIETTLADARDVPGRVQRCTPS